MMAAATSADLVAGARGEFILPHFLPAYDAMYATAKLLEAVARSGERLRALVDRCEPMYIRQGRVACPWGRKGRVMRRLMEATESERRELVDGVKVWKNDEEWALVIPHSHKPYFVVTVEGLDPERAESSLAEYTERVERWRDEG